MKSEGPDAERAEVEGPETLELVGSGVVSAMEAEGVTWVLRKSAFNEIGLASHVASPALIRSRCLEYFRFRFLKLF